jgi:tetratricopeptide (TPR) repeat protein
MGQGVSAILPPLLQRGRLKAAAAALKRLAQGGAPAWEILLWVGRLHERQGRWAEAERAYRKALAAAPPRPADLELELARFLEKRGRLEEAEARLAPLARGGGAPGAVRQTRERLREKIKAAAAAEWTQDFSALLHARRYREAFRLGDTMLQSARGMRGSSFFLWPWARGVSSRPYEAKLRFSREELRRIRWEAGQGGFPRWFAYCRGVLLLALGRKPEGMAEFARIGTRRPGRYACLLQPFVFEKLLAGEVDETIAICRAALRQAPESWWFRCRMAEAFLVRGDVAQGLRAFEAAQRAANAAQKPAVATWQGEALLWLGRYQQALRRLDAAAADGARAWVHCWRGAARLKLGDWRGALADLGRAIARDPQDLEAYVWRGEAYRLLGRLAEARRDLDRAVELDPGYGWAHADRALVRHALGDDAGMAEDFAAVPAEVTGLLRRRLRLRAAGALSPAQMREVLTAALARAKGIRRPEAYLNGIWMGCWPRQAAGGANSRSRRAPSKTTSAIR